MTFTSCLFEWNSASYLGGGLFLTADGVTLTDCTFRGNSAWHGGGLKNYGSSGGLTLVNCIFSDNSVGASGGGLSTDSALSSLTNCTFCGNSAADDGGAVCNVSRGWDEVNTTLLSCVFAGNTAARGNAVACVLYDQDDESFAAGSVSVVNSILWDGGEEIANPIGLDMAIAYSNVRGGPGGVHDPCMVVVWGDGNIDTDPLFADPGYLDPNGTPDDGNDDFWVAGNYHLKSQAGRYDPATQSWVIDDVTSPCIDAGDPMSPIGLEPFPNGGRVNMGAYGGTPQASKSYFGGPPCETVVAGDINGDCRVDFLDFQIVGLHWLETSQ